MHLPPFSVFLEREREVVYRVLVGLVGPDDADDCFQETFIKALRAYPGLRDARNLRGWVLTIARRTAIDSVRARGRRPDRLDDPDGIEAPAAPEPSDPALWAAVRALPPRQREAVALHHMGGLPYAEVGQAMGCSEDAARRSAFEGIRRLREVWDGG
jgi:RNA polymerase sigma factor (sigma-70 family)